MSAEKEHLWKRWKGKIRKLTRLQSIKGKIFAFFALTLLSTTALTALNLWNLSDLQTRMMLSAHYDDLLNNILEVRRFEKNFLIYGDDRSLLEGSEYLNSINLLVNDLSADLTLLIGEEQFNAFQAALVGYCTLVGQIIEGKEVSAENLRNLGKKLTDSADHFRAIKHKRIHATITHSSMLPFAFFVIVLLFMGLVLSLIFYSLLKPLDLVMETTRSVARGDFSPIAYRGVQLDEISGLIEAFNRMAHELETNHEDLIQARKIAAIGTFTAGIAHELNNPINNIVLTAESFGEEYGDSMNASCLDMLRDILNQAERAADIVKNLLDFSRTEAPTFTTIAPAQIMKSTVNLIKNQFKVVGVQLQTSIAKDLPLIRGNNSNLQQVFTNLLLNALQATPKGGQVNVRVDLANTIHGYVRFVIEDTGPGIPPEIQHKIFEPFFTTKEVGKGTGLGLAVTYSIIKRHGGRIDVTSEPGQGARFTVLLPSVNQTTNRDFLGWTAS